MDLKQKPIKDLSNCAWKTSSAMNAAFVGGYDYLSGPRLLWELLTVVDRKPTKSGEPAAVSRTPGIHMTSVSSLSSVATREYK